MRKSDTITRRKLGDRKGGMTDWARVDALTDEDIEKAVAEDPDAAPLLDEEWFAKARLLWPQEKAAISIRLDQDVVDFFKAQGRGYQTRINAVLRAYIEAQKSRKTG
jgi:uncharacterized protein (DUF4415 family)